MVGTNIRNYVGPGSFTIILQNITEICFWVFLCLGKTQNMLQGCSCSWEEVWDNFALCRRKRAPSKFRTAIWLALLWLSATGTREIRQSGWLLADTGVMTWYDGTSAMIVGPQAWKELSLGCPSSQESCLQKITAENHVRTGIKPEYSTYCRRKAKQRPAQTGVWALMKCEVHSRDIENAIKKGTCLALDLGSVSCLFPATNSKIQFMF